MKDWHAWRRVLIYVLAGFVSTCIVQLVTIQAVQTGVFRFYADTMNALAPHTGPILVAFIVVSTAWILFVANTGGKR